MEKKLLPHYRKACDSGKLQKRLILSVKDKGEEGKG